MARPSSQTKVTVPKGIVPRLGMSKGAWRRHGRRNRAPNINRWGYPKAVEFQVRSTSVLKQRWVS